MERHQGRARRRAVVTLVVGMCAIVGLLLAGLTTAGASSPGRKWLDVKKTCPAKDQKYAPEFTFHNNTDNPAVGSPQAITFTMSDRYFLAVSGQHEGPFTLQPGETMTWTAPDTWKVVSPIKTDFKYYALFNIIVGGKSTAQRSDEYCVCSTVTTTTNHS